MATSQLPMATRGLQYLGRTTAAALLFCPHVNVNKRGLSAPCLAAKSWDQMRALLRGGTCS